MPPACPRCGHPLLPGTQHWICEECGHKVPRSAPQAAAAPWVQFPSLLSLPLADYEREQQAVLKLHRLCDAGELFVRFCVTVALGELRQLSPDLPPRAIAVLQEHIERPTFGRWLAMLRVLLEHLPPTLPLLVPDLLPFVRQTLLPALGGGDGGKSGEDPERNLIDLRNLLCHGGAMRTEVAEHYLNGVGPAGAGAGAAGCRRRQTRRHSSPRPPSSSSTASQPAAWNSLPTGPAWEARCHCPQPCARPWRSACWEDTCCC